MSARFIFFLIVLSICAIRSPQFRDVETDWPEGTIDLEKRLENRWHEKVATAIEMLLNGPAGKNTVLHSELSFVYRDALSNLREPPCKITDDSQCVVAVNGFGKVGEVEFGFIDGLRKVAGRATQVMVACRCLDEDCGSAVLIRPINVFEELPPNAKEEPVQKTCLYEVVQDGFSDCHTEVLHSVTRRIHHDGEHIHGDNHFAYNSYTASLKTNRTARGQRGWTHGCSVSEVSSLETVTVEDLSRSNIHRSRTRKPAGNGCKPPEGVRYFREENATEGEACYAMYEYASAFASNLASRQGDTAFVTMEESYANSKTPTVSDTELALACSSAGLGLLFVWGLFKKRLNVINPSASYLVALPVNQVIGFALEALPLHMALGQEVAAWAWRSEFAFLDGSIKVAGDELGAQGSAERGVLVLTALLGTAKYTATRVGLVGGLVLMFDMVAAAVIIATIA